jgi:hypothetical protein
MIKYFGHLLLLILLISCETEASILGNWEEVHYQKEILQFHEDGRMEIKQKGEKGSSPINFKYEILESKEDYVMLNVSIYDGETFVKKAKHKITFKNENTITVENVDFPEVKSNTYSRK